jgi:hypothetical protein
MFIGEVEGKPVVASLLTGCGGVLTGRLTGMDRGSQAGRLHVNGAVVWEAIRWAKANKYRVFDFGGISDTAVSALENAHCDKSALTTSEAFKLTFGGTPFRFPMPVEMIYSPMIRFAYDISMRWPVGRRLVEQTAHRLRADRSQRTGGSHRGAYVGESSNPSAAVGPSHSKSMGQERG